MNRKTFIWLSQVLFLVCLFYLVTPVMAVSRCPGCSFPVNVSAIECPKCLKLLQWPFVPERGRKAKVIVRTGSDAFIRHPQAKNRAWRDDRNAGGDSSGEIGVWGGPTTLRYLIKFDVERAFAYAGVSLTAFKAKRVFLKITSIVNDHNIDMPVAVYPLTRPFLEGRSSFRNRAKDDEGCTWYHSAPLLPWHNEGGDFNRSVVCKGIIYGNGRTSLLDITEIFRLRLQEFEKSGRWQDVGMIIMADPQKVIRPGFVTIFSFESRPIGGIVRSPELFIE
jgi:hypothetical protein